MLSFSRALVLKWLLRSWDIPFTAATISTHLRVGPSKEHEKQDQIYVRCLRCLSVCTRLLSLTSKYHLPLAPDPRTHLHPLCPCPTRPSRREKTGREQYCAKFHTGELRGIAHCAATHKLATCGDGCVKLIDMRDWRVSGLFGETFIYFIPFSCLFLSSLWLSLAVV